MNELLQKHGCSNVFSVPEGLRELMADITREVLREQPNKLFDFIANYLSVLLLTREHGVMAVKVLDDLCDCRPSVSEHLMQLGLAGEQARDLAQIIKQEIEQFEPVAGSEKIKEMQIMKTILTRSTLDEMMASKVCQVARNAYRDYWYRKKTLEQSMKTQPDAPWEIAAQHTLEIYKKTKPSFTEMNRAAEKIQAAYRGYHLRRNLLKHLKQKKKGPKVELPGPPLDIGGSREIELGPVLKLRVPKDNVRPMFVEHTTQKLGIPYDPMLTITHVPEDQESITSAGSRGIGRFTDRPAIRTSSIVSNTAPGARQVLMTATVEMKGPTSVVESTPKISFAEVPPEVIPDFQWEFLKENDVSYAAEQEIPEDIPDDKTDGDSESILASAPSTARDSASITDVEDEGDNATAITDEEAG
ncbi:uncharacterized protein LOC123706819 [Pieris brassicae]|uniref:RIIa domain-containing protein n=1 Tax=Pieris brassicae TaxID=7116 RepID=A0A9P0T791_PIEBR|nr:uncharacterized protein LOC123706819 [Pieris brassicae]CAH4020863.1 unnamed protein product [Pieris brassicae]